MAGGVTDPCGRYALPLPHPGAIKNHESESFSWFFLFPIRKIADQAKADLDCFIPCSSSGDTDSIVLRCNQRFLTYMNLARHTNPLRSAISL